MSDNLVLKEFCEVIGYCKYQCFPRGTGHAEVLRHALDGVTDSYFVRFVRFVVMNFIVSVVIEGLPT